MRAEGSTQVEQGEIAHTPEAIQEWAPELRRRFPTGRRAVALEQSRGPLVFASSKYVRPSGAKSDGPDVAML